MFLRRQNCTWLRNIDIDDSVARPIFSNSRSYFFSLLFTHGSINFWALLPHREVLIMQETTQFSFLNCFSKIKSMRLCVCSWGREGKKGFWETLTKREWFFLTKTIFLNTGRTEVHGIIEQWELVSCYSGNTWWGGELPWGTSMGDGYMSPSF